MKPTKVSKSLSEESRSSVPEVGSDFTGIARSVECFDNQGFKNFRIVTLTIENGKVIRQGYSDAYASFEAISRLEMSNEMSIHKLNNAWESGKTLGL